MKLQVKDKSQTYTYNYEDNIWFCSHKDAYLEKACCSERGSSGYIECGCGGQDEIICPNPDCTRLTDEDIETIGEL